MSTPLYRLAMGRLTAMKVKNISDAGMYGDGQGFWLQIKPHGGKS
ncbi:MAG TPA: DUF4102 domain-containing protein [Magnetococcales bacterium]|nr:DUF4102 domain-containing protein [Magnetococcales bacterium]